MPAIPLATLGQFRLGTTEYAAGPTTGAVPLLTLAVPPNQTVTLPIPASKYVAFSVGLALAVGTAATLGTLVVGLLGTTGVTANDMVVNLTYT